MDIKKRVIATLAGTVSLFLLGWIFYGMLFMDFFESNSGSAIGVMRSDEEMVYWALILGNVFQAYLLVYVFDKWGAVNSFGEGLKCGAILGLIVALGMDFILYGTTNNMNLTATMVDPLIVMVMMGLTGGIIGIIIKKD